MTVKLIVMLLHNHHPRIETISGDSQSKALGYVHHGRQERRCGDTEM
jgi:hypothetical protein